MVYTKFSKQGKIPLLDSLIAHKFIMNNQPCLIVGDFNVVSRTNNKKGGNPIDHNAVADFNLLISNEGLLDGGF